MASVGHVAIGLVVGRYLRPRPVKEARATMALFSGLALLPDLDYVGVALGVINAGPCGHRGATHSLIPVLLAAALGMALAPSFRVSRTRAALFTALVVASHPLLDSLTDRGRGVPILWPFTFQRFSMPWRPIPDAPCGLAYVSLEGLRVAAIEFLQFSPFLAAAFWPRVPISRRLPHLSGLGTPHRPVPRQVT